MKEGVKSKPKILWKSYVDGPKGRVVSSAVAGLSSIISFVRSVGNRSSAREEKRLQPADIGLPTGNGKKLSCSQAQLGQATGLAVA